MVKMLLRDVSMTDLADMYRRNADRSPAPYLKDPKAIRRAKRLAKKNGVWDDLSERLDSTQDIPVMKRSAFRNYQRIGDRALPQAVAGYRRGELGRAGMALWLKHPNANVDYLQDLLWAYCDDHTWVMAAHEGRAIDLGSAALGSTFAEILHLLGDQLEDEVVQRVSAKIEEHIFEPFWNYKHMDSWKTVRMNWNHVCNGEIIRAALYQIQDPVVLAHMTHAAIINLTYALDGFTDDGGCEEGPGYWEYGFGHFLYVAHALYLKTNGELNLMTDESGKISRICEYPLAAHIHGALRSTFADSSHGYTGARSAMIVNAFHDLSELYALCNKNPDGTLKVQDMHSLAMYSGFKVKAEANSRDYVLPNLGQAKLRGKPGKKQLTLMCLAGNNGVPHNHNDIGSFILHRGDTLWLTDPGGPVYSRKTFGPNRYDILFCNSLGHSVPVVNGVLQQPGGEYFGTLEVENLNGEGEKRAVVDMTHAYPKGTVKNLVRTFVLDANVLTLEDRFVFGRKPRTLEEGFITFETVKINRGGRSVQIGPKSKGITLSAVDIPGKFSIKRFEEASDEGRTDQVVTRVIFTPEQLSKELCLRFTMG
jgi:hypothetical protein